MLNIISDNLGGMVRINSKDQSIIWVVNNKRTIKNIIEIFTIYPPLTKRLKAQLIFLIECLNHNDVEKYLMTRKLKYHNIEFNIDYNCNYFNEWLSGFMEAESCFSMRQKNNNSFSISQKNEYSLLNFIKNYFKITTKIHERNDVYILETYKKSTLLNIIAHCDKYPLIGEKLTSFNKLKNLVKK